MTAMLLCFKHKLDLVKSVNSNGAINDRNRFPNLDVGFISDFNEWVFYNLC